MFFISYYFFKNRLWGTYFVVGDVIKFNKIFHSNIRLIMLSVLIIQVRALIVNFKELSLFFFLSFSLHPLPYFFFFCLLKLYCLLVYCLSMLFFQILPGAKNFCVLLCSFVFFCVSIVDCLWCWACCSVVCDVLLSLMLGCLYPVLLVCFFCRVVLV